MSYAIALIALVLLVVIVATLARRYFDRQKAKRDESMREIAKQLLDEKENDKW